MKHSRTTTRNAFSLIEVTIAMGIVATVIIALMGLLPLGMESIREAKNTMIIGRIVNEITSELQTADWGPAPNFAKLKQFTTRIRRYDSEGSPIDQSTRLNVAYQALVDLDSARKASLPGNKRTDGRYLREVSIKVAFSPGGKDVDFKATKAPLPYKAYNTMVVNVTKESILDNR